MRIVCLHIPRRPTTDAGAIYETTWELVNAKFFLHQLDDLAECMWEPLSLELYSSNNIVYICVAGSDDVIDYMMTSFYTWLGDGEIREVEDYTRNIDARTAVVGAEVRLWRSDIYPIYNYKAYSYDSMAPVITPLSHLPEGDRLLIQLVVRPIKDTGLLHAGLALERSKEKINRLFQTRTWLKKGLPTKTIELVHDKCLRRLFYVNYRIAAFSQVPAKGAAAHSATIVRLSQHVKNVANSVRVYNAPDENKLILGKIETGASFLRRIQERRFRKPYRLSTIELTTLWHPPSLGTLPNTAQVLSKKGPPPRTLPSNPDDAGICFFGHTNFRDHVTPFGIKRTDRRRHLYLLGKSGSGKSCLIQLLVRNDIENGFGCAVLDPHGDLIDDILKLIPKHRINDVVIFDPSDVQFPPSFNPMHALRPDLKTRVTLSFLDTFRRVFGSDWSEKMDHVLRYAMMGLLSIPGSNIMSLRRMLSDESFRIDVVRQATDESVKRFWLREFVSRRQDFVEGPIARLLNRLDQLLATDMIRNILGQPRNLFDFREFMDSRKIVLLKISKGVLGAENATLLGSLVIWKIYEAAMSRADIPAEQRQDFYFYIDEFQNFATDSFGEILGESRKYRLCLTFANQFLGQLPASIRKTVFGNVANLLTFRIGAGDVGTVAQELRPRFGEEDALNLALREFYLKMSVDGEVQEAFSGRTLDLNYPPADQQFGKECLAHSRSKYSLILDRAHQERVRQEGGQGEKQVGNS